ncbi:MAG: hypothetical protein KDK34_06400 [Leptospiraceae bacterium]|nr:hypothetical protein [Leptospiraceae bacterium]
MPQRTFTRVAHCSWLLTSVLLWTLIAGTLFAEEGGPTIGVDSQDVGPSILSDGCDARAYLIMSKSN